MIPEAQNSARAVPRRKCETDFGDQHEAPVRFGLIVEPQSEQLLRVHRAGATTDVQSRIIAIGREVIGAGGEYGHHDEMLIPVAGRRAARERECAIPALLEFVEADEGTNRRVRTIHPARLPNGAAPAPAGDVVACVADGDRDAVLERGEIPMLRRQRRQRKHEH